MKNGNKNSGLFWEVDSNHAWLKVDMADLFRSGAHEDISGYSYVDAARGVAYLEEDCDAGTYLKAIGWDGRQNYVGRCCNIVDGDSWVRTLPSFTAGKMP
jgi:hypothetical protein